MSIDHSVVTLLPDPDPLFAHVKARMTVILEDNGDWWMADVIHVIGGVRNAKLPRFLKVAGVEARVVRWIKADLVIHIVPRIHESVVLSAPTGVCDWRKCVYSQLHLRQLRFF